MRNRKILTSGYEKGILVNLFTDASISSDASNGGISTRHNLFLVPCDSGNILIEGSEYPVLDIVRQTFSHGTFLKAVEREKIQSGEWTMMGGTFIYSCDSRFRKYSNQPISLHDRMED